MTHSHWRDTVFRCSLGLWIKCVLQTLSKNYHKIILNHILRLIIKPCGSTCFASSSSSLSSCRASRGAGLRPKGNYVSFQPRRNENWPREELKDCTLRRIDSLRAIYDYAGTPTPTPTPTLIHTHTHTHTHTQTQLNSIRSFSAPYLRPSTIQR